MDDVKAQLAYYQNLLQEQTELIARQEVSIGRMRARLRQKEQAFKMLAHFSEWVGTRPTTHYALERTASEIIRFLDHKKVLAFSSSHHDASEEAMVCIAARGHWPDSNPMQDPAHVPCLNAQHIEAIGQGIFVNASTPVTPTIGALREAIGLHYFVAAIVRGEQGHLGLLAGGTVEREPVLRHLDEADLATFVSLTTLLGALLENTERARRAQAHFLSRMSHELRTPLNAIIGYTELIDEEVEADFPWNDELSRVHTAGRHMLELVEQVLDISMSEEGDQRERSHNTSRFALHTMLEEILKALFAHHADTDRLTLTCPDDLWLHSDPSFVRRAPSHVIENALRFCPTEPIEVQARPTTQPQGVTCVVTDRGEGIAADRLESIFLPFYQVDESFTRQHDGAGLGLPIARKCVERVGGTIHAESTPGQGSTFTLWFPAQPQPVSPEC